MVFVFDVPLHTMHQNQVLHAQGRLSGGLNDLMFCRCGQLSYLNTGPIFKQFRH